MCLGTIAVFIAIQYMNTSDKLVDEIKEIRTKCIAVSQTRDDKKRLNNLKDFERESGLTLDDMKTLIKQYKATLTSKINKEGFQNYEGMDKKNTDLIYSSSQFRGILNDGDKIKKHIDYNKINSFPSINRDISILINKKYSNENIENIIYKNAGSNLFKVELFDLYKGKNISEDSVSMAYSLIFKSNKKTLTDKEVDKDMIRVMKELKNKFDVIQR